MNTAALRPPVTLPGRYIDLVPLELGHLDALAEAGRHPEIWTYMFAGPGETREQMAVLIDTLLRRQSAGTDLPFTIVRKGDRAPVGMTRYLNIEGMNEAVEVGGSWLTPSLWRSPVNTDAKRRILAHAFDVVGVHRVQIKTDVRNVRSQKAIERLGAVREGVLRDHMRSRTGAFRTSVFYSILAGEWPEVRARLDAALARRWDPMPPGWG